MGYRPFQPPTLEYTRIRGVQVIVLGKSTVAKEDNHCRDSPRKLYSLGTAPPETVYIRGPINGYI